MEAKNAQSTTRILLCFGNEGGGGGPETSVVERDGKTHFVTEKDLLKADGVLEEIVGGVKECGV
jgi:hypothetical protein